MAVGTDERRCGIVDQVRNRKSKATVADGAEARTTVHAVSAKSTHTAKLRRGQVSKGSGEYECQYYLQSPEAGQQTAK